MSKKGSKKTSDEAGVLSWLAVVVFTFLFVILVFKIGVSVGMTNGIESESDEKKILNVYMGKKLKSAGDELKSVKNKLAYAERKLGVTKTITPADYSVVISVSDYGYVVLGSNGIEREISVADGTAVYKGSTKTGTTVKVGDKIYVEASVIKVLE